MSEECLACIRHEKRYLPAVGDFPPEEAVAGYKAFIRYEGEGNWHFRGLYVPTAGAVNTEQPQGWNASGWIQPLIINLVILASLFFLGGQIIAALAGPTDWRAVLHLAIPLGAGVFTWLWFLTSWLGLPLSVTSLAMLFTALTLPLAKYNHANGRLALPRLAGRSNFLRPLRQQKDALALLGLAFFGALFALFTLASITRSYSTFDGIANWALKGYGIALERTIFAGARWGGHVLSYPQNVPLMIAMFRLADGDLLPGSKLLFPLFAFSLFLGLHRYLRAVGVRNWLSALWIGLVATTPGVFFYATTGFANLPFTTYIVLGALEAARGLISSRRGLFLTGTLLLALGAWTRPEGLAFAVALLAALFLALHLSGKRHAIRPWPALLFGLIPATFLIFSFRSISGDEIGRTADAFASALGRGEWNFTALPTILRFALHNTFSTGRWGLFYPLATLALLAAAVRARYRPEGQAVALAALTLTAIAFTLVMFYIASFDKPNLYTFLSVSFDRAFLPATMLLAALAAFVTERLVSSPLRTG